MYNSQDSRGDKEQEKEVRLKILVELEVVKQYQKFESFECILCIDEKFNKFNEKILFCSYKSQKCSISCA